MKRFYRVTKISLLVLLISCRGSDKKETPADNTEKNFRTDTSVNTTGDTSAHINNNASRPPEDKMPEQVPAAKPGNTLEGSNEILANIDNYLVSTVNNGVLTVKNTLSDITFQKAIAEVSLIAADGTVLGNYFPVLQNIEPGDIKTVKVPGNSRTNSINCHIVKLKSDQLTKGQMIMVGTHYEGK
jgi:hypothetical protein